MKVIVDMETRQWVPGDGAEVDVLRHRARGILREAGGTYKVTYLLDGVHYEMWIDRARDSVRVVRNWNEGQIICYEPGREHEVLYETEAGAFTVSFRTRSVEIGTWEEGLPVVLEYGLSQFGQPVAYCRVRIDIAAKTV